MAMKPNYGQQRFERERAKRAKKAEKLREQQEEVARRKAGGEAPAPELAEEKQDK
ncbi:MAG: hypothetical protein HYR63_27825 [Proteobacteria bacterium]|nr:hypothetical protein [Pseudomonadota bacterium]MBI3497898.1 hypothetical protein [Pseudomonadota bacterium]